MKKLMILMLSAWCGCAKSLRLRKKGQEELAPGRKSPNLV